MRNGQVEENDDESVLVGCRKRKNSDRFYDRTAGVLAVRPCGIAAVFCEMLTRELPSQVFFFIFNSFGKAAENFSTLKVLGYDRTCYFHPLLERLAKRGNLGAQLLLSKVKFLVDKFHCERHTEATCFLPDNPRCNCNPDLDLNDFQKFRERIQSVLSNFSNGWGHLNSCAKNVALQVCISLVEYCGQEQQKKKKAAHESWAYVKCVTRHARTEYS